MGFSAETRLNQLKCTNKISERQALEIKKECKAFLITILGKLQGKTPVQHQLVRSMQCLDPRSMAESKEKSFIQMKRVLQNLVADNHVDETACDDILQEFGEFCDFASLQYGFKDFDPKTEKSMGISNAFSNAWNMVKMLLVLSHGQASVESGFSINKELIVENQKEASLVAQRLIVGHIRAVCFDLEASIFSLGNSIKGYGDVTEKSWKTIYPKC